MSTSTTTNNNHVRGGGNSFCPTNDKTEILPNKELEHSNLSSTGVMTYPEFQYYSTYDLNDPDIINSQK